MNPLEFEALTMRDLIVERAALGDKPLLRCRDVTLTYVEADELSNRVANSLAEAGIVKGDIVATLMYNSTDHALVWFACAKLGAVFAPLNVSLGRDDLVYSLDDCGAKAVVVDSDLLPQYVAARPHNRPGMREYLWRSPESPDAELPGAEEFTSLLSGKPGLPDAVVRPEDPMGIVYTGGSTSMPKGVLVSHVYYIAAAERYKEIVEPVPDDVHFANSHFFHIGGQQFGVSGPLYCGITGAMAKWFSASRYFDTVVEANATIIDPLGTMISVLLKRPSGPADRNHRIRLGVGIASGQVRRELRDEFEERFGIRLLEVYSMTEMGVLICSERQDDRRVGSSGRTHGWADVLIVDESDMPVPNGTTGQILLRPNAINCAMIEYVNKPIETLNAWRNLWYHTGDLGYRDDDGYIYFVGRQAHWIRRRGENVSSFEVEKVITAHPAVADCGVVGLPSDLGEEDIKAYVQLHPGAVVGPDDVVTWCRERIAFFKVPRYIEFVSEFPRTITKNEIARHELRERGVGNAWDAEAML